MNILTHINEVLKYRSIQTDKTVGFVATMGALHKGHLQLIERSKTENDLTIVSIFVNPKQFNNKEDLNRYPRDHPADIKLLTRYNIDLLFIPEVGELYPESFETSISVTKSGTLLEGAARPGHFDGVTTIVAKLFNIIAPTRAYFGKKDAQQLRVIQRMVCDLNMQLEIVPCSTLRESDGLALSSRNKRLTPTDRANAPILYQALQMAEEQIKKGEKNAHKVIQLISKEITKGNPERIDYVAVNNSETLEPLSFLRGKVLVSLAVFFGSLRLIDNIEVVTPD